MHDVMIVVSEQYYPLRTDDQLLLEALKKRGLDVIAQVWNAPDFKPNAKVIVIRALWDYAENIDTFLEWVDEVSKHTKLMNPPSVIKQNYDKCYLFDLKDKGVNIPETYLVKSLDDFKAYQNTLSDTVVIKPVVGAGGRNIYKINKHDEQALVKLLNDRGTLLVQPFLHAINTTGEYSALYVNHTMTHLILKTPIEGEFKTQFHYGGKEKIIREKPTNHQAFLSTVETNIPKNAHYARIDYTLDNQGNFCLMELELIEPNLFLEHDQASVEAFATTIEKALEVSHEDYYK